MKTENEIRQEIADQFLAMAQECANAAEDQGTSQYNAMALASQAVIWRAAGFMVLHGADGIPPAREIPEPVEEPATMAPEAVTEQQPSADAQIASEPVTDAPEASAKVFQPQTLPGDRTLYLTKAVRLAEWSETDAAAEGWEEYLIMATEKVVYLRRHVQGEPTSSERWTAL